MTPPSDDPVRFPRVAFYAGLSTLIGGLVVAVSGVQVLMLVEVRGAWSSVPPLMIALGVASVPAGGALTNARVWAAWASTILSGVAAGLSLVWGVYALLNGLFTLTPFFGALLAALGGALALAAMVPVLRYARSQANLFAPDPSLPGGASTLPAPGPPPQRPWPLIVAMSLAAGLGGALLAALNYPDQADRIVLRLQLLTSGRLPPGPADFVDQRHDYPYNGSPYLEYLDYEGRFVQIDRARAERLADDIAVEVGLRMLTETGADTVDEAERQLWTAGDSRKIPLWIARGLRSRGVFYHQESLLSRSFDPALHTQDDLVHLDCDQLAHLYEHVAWRLDLRMEEIQSPLHVYLQLSPPEGASGETLTIEATNFRSIDVNGDRVDFMGEGIGEGYFIDADYHSSGESGTYASAPLVEAAGLYQPATARDITDMIVSNVVVGLHERHIEAPYLDELRAHLDGTRSYVLVSNLHTWTLEQASQAMEVGEPALAAERAREAIEIRARFPQLVLVQDPEDQILLIRAMIAQGQNDAARETVQTLLKTLDERYGVLTPPTAHTMAQSEALVLSARLDPPRSARDCDDRLGAVLRLEEQLRFSRRLWSGEACALASGAGGPCDDVSALCGSR